MPVNRKTLCPSHKPVLLNYLEYLDWADEQEAKGIKQKQCEVCKHWFYPEEF